MQTGTKEAGRHSDGMVHRILAIAALFYTAGCGQAPNQAVNYRPEEAGTIDHALCLLGFVAVPLREVTTGHHLVEAQVNGRTGSFVLDTGANVTVINAADTAQFGVSNGSDGVAALGGGLPAGGAGRANLASVDDFEIGRTEIRQEQVVVADLASLLGSLGQASGEHVVGIIGQDVLSEHRAIIDVARPMLYLMEEDRDPAPIPAAECQGEGREGNVGQAAS